MSDRKLLPVLGLCFAVVLAIACQRPMPSPTPVSIKAWPDDAGPVCAAGMGPNTPDSSCDGRFTADGLNCAMCEVDAGCLSARLQVWCVNSCADPACGIGKHR